MKVGRELFELFPSTLQNRNQLPLNTKTQISGGNLPNGAKFHQHPQFAF